MKLLYIIANPKKENSVSIEVSNNLVEEFKKNNPNAEVETLNLYDEKLGHLSIDSLMGKNTDMKDKAIHFSSFDRYVIASPMWNLSIPSILKAYIDYIMVKGIGFNYNKYGVPYGLLKNKKAVCVFARGGVYSYWPMTIFAHDKKYMKHILNFVGIKDIKFLEVDGLDKYPNKKQNIIAKAMVKAAKLARKL